MSGMALNMYLELALFEENFDKPQKNSHME